MKRLALVFTVLFSTPALGASSQGLACENYWESARYMARDFHYTEIRPEHIPEDMTHQRRVADMAWLCRSSWQDAEKFKACFMAVCSRKGI